MMRREHRAERLARRSAELYDWLSANPKRGLSDIAAATGVTKFSARTLTRKMVEAGLIIQMYDPSKRNIKVGKYYFVVVPGKSLTAS